MRKFFARIPHGFVHIVWNHNAVYAQSRFVSVIICRFPVDGLAKEAQKKYKMKRQQIMIRANGLFLSIEPERKEDHLHRLNNDIKARINETTGSIPRPSFRRFRGIFLNSERVSAARTSNDSF